MIDIKKIINTAFTLLLVLVALFMIGLRILGYTPYSIASSSMSPTYKIGDIVYTKPIKLEDLKKGDTIAFKADEDLLLITHRVIDIDEKNKLIYTKGDNNSQADSSPIRYKDILGKIVFKIPLIGYVSSFFMNEKGIYVYIGIIVVLIILLLIPFKRKKEI